MSCSFRSSLTVPRARRSVSRSIAVAMLNRTPLEGFCHSPGPRRVCPLSGIQSGQLSTIRATRSQAHNKTDEDTCRFSIAGPSESSHLFGLSLAASPARGSLKSVEPYPATYIRTHNETGDDPY